MFAYNIYWEVYKSMLLYPKTKETEEKFGTFHKGITGKSQCKLGFVNVLIVEGNLNKNVGREILRKFTVD